MGLVPVVFNSEDIFKNLQDIRELGVKLKLNPIKQVINGKDIVLVDDSIVRGTTSRQIVKMLKDSGARKVHMRVASPPIIGPNIWAWILWDI